MKGNKLERKEEEWKTITIRFLRNFCECSLKFHPVNILSINAASKRIPFWFLCLFMRQTNSVTFFLNMICCLRGYLHKPALFVTSLGDYTHRMINSNLIDSAFCISPQTFASPTKKSFLCVYSLHFVSLLWSFCVFFLSSLS